MNNCNTLRWVLAAAALVALAVLLGRFTDRRPGAPAEPVRETIAAATSDKVDTAVAVAGGPAPDGNTAWIVIDPESVDELPPYKEVVPGRALVKVSDALRLGWAGDRIELAVPQLGRSFDGVVETVDTDPYGNVTYIGLLTEAEGQGYRFIITAGARNTFAHLGTSRGTFELVANKDDLGWLMPTSNMDQHVDYSKPDYFIREEPPPDRD